MRRDRVAAVGAGARAEGGGQPAAAAAARLRRLATSLAACGDDDTADLEAALREVVPEVQAYLAKKGTTSDDVVTVNREQRLHA